MKDTALPLKHLFSVGLVLGLFVLIGGFVVGGTPEENTKLMKLQNRDI